MASLSLQLSVQLEDDTLRFGYIDMPKERFSEVLQVMNLCRDLFFKKSQFVRKFIYDYVGSIDTTFAEDVRLFEQVVHVFKNFYFCNLAGVQGSCFDSVPHYLYYTYVMLAARLKKDDVTLEGLLLDNQFLKTCMVAVICERNWKNSRHCIKPCPELSSKYWGRWDDIWSNGDFDFNVFCKQVSDHLWFVKEHVQLECDIRRRDKEMRELQQNCSYWCDQSNVYKKQLGHKRVKLEVKKEM